MTLVPIRWADSLPLLLLSSCQVASWTHFNGFFFVYPLQFANPLIERRKSTYKPKKAKPESDSSDSSDGDDEPAGKKQPMRKKSVKKGKGKHAEGHDDITAPTAAPERKAKKKNILTSMFKKEQEPEDVEWEANLDDFLTQKSSLTSFTDMIPTEHWDVFKDRVRKFRTVGTEALQKGDKKKAPAPIPKASDMIDPAKYMYEDDFLELTPQKTNKLMERRKSMGRKPAVESSSDSSDSDSDDEKDEGTNGVEPGIKLGRAKSIKVGAPRQSREMRELEAGMDDFLKNKSSNGWFSGVNSPTWDAFKKSVENLRNDTEAAREESREKKAAKPRRPKSTRAMIKSNSAQDLLESLEKKKKKKKAASPQAEEGTAESVHSRMRELEEELAFEEQMRAANKVAGKSPKENFERVASIKADIGSLQQISQNLNLVGILIFICLFFSLVHETFCSILAFRARTS